VRIDDLGALLPIAGAQLILVVTNPGKIALNAMASLAFSPAPGPLSNFSNKFTAMPGDTIVCIPYKIYKAGQFRMKATIRVLGTVRYQSETDFNVPSLTAADYGYRISRSGPPDLWWAESPYKISRGREAPTEVCPVIKVSAARNEYQDFQIVARPDRAVHGVLVRCSEFTGPRGARLGASYIVVREVAYVNVAQATDETGMIGDWPDPLPPLNSAVDLAAGKNQPFWITVYVPEGIPAGVYTGSVTLTAPGWRREAPVQLRVYDFTLPRETHVQSALGISPGSIRQYQNLANEGQTKDVMAKYYADFAAHRISPYNPVWGADIKVNWGLPAVNSHNVKLDFTQFDTAMDAALARYHFNTFQLPIQAMGGGTFDARNEGRIGPYAMGSPEYETLFASYARQLQDHMEAKGWLDKAYLYWFDEPAPKDYAFVRDGMERIHKYAPKLARMLTVQPVPDLYGAVDTWCMLTPNFDEVRAHERQAAGDRLWWYICCGPKAPYVTEFIDHPAIEPRLWLWQTWKYGIQGILIWETTYWNSPTAYPNSLQNPWTDAMSWVEGYHSTVGARIPWGNGDGRYLYPPNRDPANNKAPIIDGPVDSIRWEMLRDGMQDYEYFYMLQQKVNAARARGDHSAKIDAATALLDVPAQITSGMTTFSTDPQPLLRRRDKIAEAIESLKHISLANRNGDLSHDNKKHE